MKPVLRPFFEKPLRPMSSALVLSVLAILTGCGSGGSEPAPSEQIRNLNYDPQLLQDSKIWSPQLSWSPLKLEAAGRLAGQSVELLGDYRSWFIGAVYQSALGSEDAIASECRGRGPNRIECDLRILRLAQSGQVDEPGFSWLLELEGDPLVGRVTADLDPDGQPRYPAEVEVEAHLTLMVKEDGAAEPLLLGSRDASVLSGAMKSWPDGLMVLQLRRPVAYYAKDSLEDAEAEPFLVIDRATLAFSDKPSEFFRRQPAVKAQVIDPAGGEWTKGAVGGVRLAWEDTSKYVRHDFVTHYNVYRNLSPGNPGTWQLLSTLPADRTDLLDEGYDGARSVEYLVTHGMQYAQFDFQYEGLYAPPTRVEAVR